MVTALVMLNLAGGDHVKQIKDVTGLWNPACKAVNNWALLSPIAGYPSRGKWREGEATGDRQKRRDKGQGMKQGIGRRRG